MAKYTAKDSDHIASISLSQPAFISPEKLWEMNSSRLKSASERSDPNCLFKGDRVVPKGDQIELPTKFDKIAQGIMNKFNKFEIGTKDLWVRVRIFRDSFTPVKDAPYEMTIAGVPTPFKGKTTAKGEIEIAIPNYLKKRDPSYATEASLTVRIKAKDSDTPPAGGGGGSGGGGDGGGTPAPQPVRGDVPITWTLRIGRLNPVCEKAPDKDCLSGVQQRLNNLDMNTGPVDGILGPNTKAAIKAFKDLYQLGPAGSRDGTPDTEKFQPKLQEVHDGPNPPPPPPPKPGT